MGYKKIKGIYLIERITHIDGAPIYYIGQAKDVFKRFADHYTGSEQLIDSTIQQLGFIEFTLRILEVVNKQTDRDEREEYWINHFIEQHGEASVFNKRTGGRSGTSKINVSRTREDNTIKKEIKQLFIEEIGRSIYAIAEKYQKPWEEIRDIRKPLLRKYGLKWERKSRTIVRMDNGSEPDNWHGGQITQIQFAYIMEHIGEDDDTIASGCNLSVSDLCIFREVYKANSCNYITAQTLA
jgi:hypothetical protein